MENNRQVNLNINAVTLTEIVQETGHKELQNALGYLMQWNLSFRYLTLFANMRDGPEIIGMYSNDPEKPADGYVIGAIWHGDHFGFHS